MRKTTRRKTDPTGEKLESKNVITYKEATMTPEEWAKRYVKGRKYNKNDNRDS